METIPSGTLTFLFTDIEGSTQLWERQPGAMQAALARHDACVRQAVEARGGYIFKTVGDAFYVAFATAPEALAAALAAQRALQAEAWGLTPIRVRMALHTGDAETRAGDYFGPALNRVARLLSAGHGGQTLLSLATQELVRDNLPADVSLRDLGAQRLKDLHRPEHVFQLIAPDLPADFPPLRTLDYRPNNLPAQTTPFIGREKEVAAARQRLLQPNVRLLTFTGPGGTGKTRLGLQVAADLLDEFPQGVFFAPLATVSDPALLPSAIAQALGVREVPGQAVLDALKTHLQDKRLLLVLDNFEQVAPAAPCVAELLAAAPHLKLLITSRAVLHLYGEHDFAVPPLTRPDPRHLPSLERLTQYEAVRLFIERAQAVRAGFMVDNANAPAVAEICHRLDGLPLAIELAAAWVRLLTPAAILARLEHRLPMLTGGARDLPARQRTLRGAIDWSYDLLGRAEQALFARLAVFAGGCTLEAAEAVCGDLPEGASMLETLASLVDKSLLQQTEELQGAPRFDMLETIREYAAERLEQAGEAADRRRAQAAYFLALAEAAEGELVGPQQVTWLERLEREHANARAALDWALTAGAPEAERALRLSAVLARHWLIRGHWAEGRRWLEQALAATEGQAPPVRLQAKALTALASLVGAQGEFAQTLRYQTQALALWREQGDRVGTAACLNNLAVARLNLGDYGQAQALFEESLALHRELGAAGRIGAAMAINNLGYLALQRGDYRQARPLFEEALAVQRSLGHQAGVANVLHNLGRVALGQDDYPGAQRWLEEAVALWRTVGDSNGLAFSLLNLGRVALMMGHFDQARERFQECLELHQALHNRFGVALARVNLGQVALHEGALEDAAVTFAESEAVFREQGNKWGLSITVHFRAQVALWRGDWPAATAALAEAQALFVEMDDPQGLADLAVTRGRLARRQGQTGEAERCFAEALRRYLDQHARGALAGALDGAAGVAVDQGRCPQAVRLLAAAEALRTRIGAPLPPVEQAEQALLLADLRRRLAEADFNAAWAAGLSLTPEQAVAEALAG